MPFSTGSCEPHSGFVFYPPTHIIGHYQHPPVFKGFYALSPFVQPQFVTSEVATVSYRPPAQHFRALASPPTISTSPPGPRTKISPGTLCDICSDTASGVYFGVVACHGCRAFFRRTVANGDAERFRCQNTSKCVVNKNVRNACRRCRFDKCLQAGMDANGKRFFLLIAW